jgi:hypothetical protein
MAVLHHEIGHTKDRQSRKRFVSASNDPLRKSDVKREDYMSWKSMAGASLGPASRLKESKRLQGLARRVSGYAAKDPGEFIAETYAGRRTGRRYDSQVMRAYRGARDLPGIRTGSRVAPGGTALASPRAVARDRARRRRKP